MLSPVHKPHRLRNATPESVAGNGRTVTVRLPFQPRRHQKCAHTQRKRFTVLVWHRRAGKSVFSILELILAALAFKRELGEFAYIAPKLKQAKRVCWRYLKFFTKDFANLPGYEKNEAELWIKLPGGARIQVLGADDPDSLRGAYLDGVVADEVAQMKPTIWGEVLRPMLADRHGWAIFIGTPKGVNLFSEIYYNALQDPDWHTDILRASTSGVFSFEEMAAMRKEMSDAEWAQEMDCDFGAAAEDTLIPLKDVLAAQDVYLHESAYNFAARILGVDVARYGKDKSCILLRQGLAVFPFKTYRQLSTMELASHVAAAIDKVQPDAVFVDNGGIGGGVIDRLQQLGYCVIPVDFGGRPNDERYENKRAEMWVETSKWLKSGGALPTSQVLQAELTAPKISYKNARGKMQLESKDEMRKRGLASPDIADALALTFAHPVAPKPLGERLGLKTQSRIVSDFDPFAKAA